MKQVVEKKFIRYYELAKSLPGYEVIGMYDTLEELVIELEKTLNTPGYMYVALVERELVEDDIVEQSSPRPWPAPIRSRKKGRRG